MKALMAIWTLSQREFVRFYRDRSRVIGALTPPIVFWFLIGSGLGTSFQGPGAASTSGYLQFFFSGTLVLIVLFTSVFSTISLIEDRREGFLQTVLIAPVPRVAVVLGKVLGASAVGFLQGLTFLVFAHISGLSTSVAGYIWAALVLLLCSVGLTGIGFCIAWKLDSTQGFHAVMNLFLIPMWMLSGALFPVSTAPIWLKWVMEINPVTYAVTGLQRALTNTGAPGLHICLPVLTGFAIAIVALSAWVASARDAR